MIDDHLPLLLLPGTLCDVRVFASIVPSNRPAIAVDLTGADDIATLADAVLAKAPERFIAMGFSLGGIVALELAARALDRVAAMVLIGTTARDVPAAGHAARRAQAESATDPLALIDEALWPGYVHPDRINDRALHEIVRAMARDCPPETFRRQTEIALSRVDSRSRLAGYTVPVLILSGEDDVVAPPETQAELAAGLPNAQIETIPGAGHLVPLEQPNVCALAITRWLAALSQDVPTHLSSANSGTLEVS
jgi:pimeloyl-ACP methyl ester carboxylesterase